MTKQPDPLHYAMEFNELCILKINLLAQCISRIILLAVIDVILIARKSISMPSQSGSRHEFLITKLRPIGSKGTKSWIRKPLRN